MDCRFTPLEAIGLRQGIHHPHYNVFSSSESSPSWPYAPFGEDIGRQPAPCSPPLSAHHLRTLGNDKIQDTLSQGQPISVHDDNCNSPRLESDIHTTDHSPASVGDKHPIAGAHCNITIFPQVSSANIPWNGLTHKAPRPDNQEDMPYVNVNAKNNTNVGRPILGSNHEYGFQGEQLLFSPEAGRGILTEHIVRLNSHGRTYSGRNSVLASSTTTRPSIITTFPIGHWNQKDQEVDHKLAVEMFEERKNANEKKRIARVRYLKRQQASRRNR